MSEQLIKIPSKPVPEGLKGNVISTTLAGFLDLIYNCARSNPVWLLT